ncbi:RelA/SpoT family protein [Papillibacter cinnamivorans]|uniref:GTP diphosphokinase n=1 Tax=Papillibacter cinnamivorans DSM 12816 TaxID=1122930 RepID=A0A1W2A2P0_9FIRM|nr:bifunctional (p)ppGpp synthetase/guanosine-3',5'-bis(diphosphate) 3'-pyrophosphohydrolase [Papillibacter cinnamivorans]SMC54578.1 GTP pyrophosphokinase [Papillibacter cinnamivorans DSM 12816]
MDPILERYYALENKIKSYNPALDTKRLFAAFQFADAAHNLQTRKDGSPYVTHPLSVAEIVAEMGLDIDSIIAALLHDCIEDAGITHEEIAKSFGPVVADLVEGVTKLTRVVYTSKEEEQMENLRKMLMAMAKDIRVILIKIADRLHNMRTLKYQSARKQKEKALETMEIYAPIAHRLGMQKIKWELEDLSLQYLDPIGYAEISTELAQRSTEHEKFLESIRSQIEARMEEEHVHSQVYGRVKHIYSIYRKMYSQNKTLSEVYDLYAFRVIVDNIPDCYNVLGYLHDLFKPVLGRFKDYIAMPKPNMYQSLHTTVIGREGIPFEVQIRTWDMHHTAEYGIAAHWKYKQGLEGRLGTEEKLEWVRRLLENQQDTDAEEFVRTLKIDMFADEVFVFTPKGDVINLPAGATPIDFAYTIHSEVGNRMVGAKVNNRIVTFDYVLQNGDIVEAVTSKSAHGPSRDWINIAKSNEARNKIKQWFKRERREENIAHGKLSFESELKRNNIPISAITPEDVLSQVLKKVAFGSLEEMYAAIGYGGLTSQKAVNRIREELGRLNRLHNEKAAAEKLAQAAPQGGAAVTPPIPPRKMRTSESGIVVEGLDNFLVKFAKCCTPVPGDKIVGFITRGYGVSVHRADCPNADPAKRKPEELGRWIDVSWAEGGKDVYHTSLQITAKNRDGLVMDIATILSTAKVKVPSLSAHEVGEGFAVISIVLEIQDVEQLDTVMRKLNQIQSVIEVKRAGG